MNGIRDWGLGIRASTGKILPFRIPNPVSLIPLLLLSACGYGFHLAGSRPLPPALRSVYIQVVAPYRVSEPPLESALRASLQRRGGKVWSSVDSASTVIRLSDLIETREVLSVGTDGKALEFKLITQVRYEVLSAGQPLLPPDMLRVTRDYSFNAQQVLAKEAEEQQLREYIQTELSELLMLRLEAGLGPVPN